MMPDVNGPNSFQQEDLGKTQKHLNLLREQYVKLQEQHSELQRIYSALKASSDESETGTESVAKDLSLASGLLRLTKQLHGNSLYSDIEIKLRHRICAGHKFVLASRGGLWGSENLQSSVSLDLQMLDSEAGDAVVKWLYTDVVELQQCSDDFVVQLMRTANKYMLGGLQLRCEQAIVSTVTVRNCIQFYQLAEEIDAKSLKDYCSSLVSMHWDDLTAEDFSTMSASVLYTMLKSKSSWPLHKAIHAKREDVVFLFLIEYNAQLPSKINERDDDGDWPLHLALSSGQLSIASTLVSHKVDVEGSDEDGKTHLHRALLAGDEVSVTFLLNNGASVNNISKLDGLTPLHIVSGMEYHNGKCSMESIARITSLLLRRGASPNITDALGRTALHISIISQNMPVFKLLLECALTDFEIRTRQGDVALWLAMKELRQSSSPSTNPNSLLSSVYNDHCMAALLIKKQCKVDSTNLSTGDSLLQLCALNRDEAGAMFLAKHGANVNHLNFHGISCLHTSALSALVSLTEYLLTHGADPNVQTRKISDVVNTSSSGLPGMKLIRDNSIYLETPLHIAIRCQHYDVVQVFLEQRTKVFHSDSVSELCAPDFNIKDSDDQTVLALAVWSGFYKIAAQLFSSGADINYKTSRGKCLLHMAIEKEDISSALFLLEHQADISIRTDENQSPLQLAVEHNLPVVVDVLCLRGADMNVLDVKGDCPLWIALQAGQEDIASTLVRHGCDTAAWAPGPDGCQQTLLHRAINDNNETIACFLIKSGCNVDCVRRTGPTGEGVSVVDGQAPLHMAAAWGLERTANVLLQHNAKINAQDNEQNTPLHIAVGDDHLAITELLLAHPYINLTLIDAKGQTPFAKAMFCKNNKCAEAILKREPGAAEQMNKKGQNFLHSAVELKDLDGVLFLISIGSDVNSVTCDSTLSTPLHLAVTGGAVLIVRNLLLAGSEVNAVNKQKQTPLHLAAIKNEATIASVLIENGADVGATEQAGNNVFHLVALHGRLETAQMLTQMVSQIHNVAAACNNKSQNPIHLLAMNGTANAASMFECFLAAVPHYPLSVQDGNGCTALLLAYMNGHGGLCRSLVRSGATLAVPNNAGINIFNHPVATKQLLFRLLDTLNQEPPWVEGSNCLECGVKFGVATRKHHCRHCGRLLCAKCSTKLMPIIKFDVSKPTRVCDLCYDVLTLGGTH